MAEIIQLKKCTSCKIEKPLTGFQKDKTKLYGVGSHCKDCIRNSWRKAHPVAEGKRTVQVELLPGEVWRAVVGFEGLYSVSSMGRVRREAPGKGTYPGKILQPGNSNGYRSVVLWKDSEHASHNIHTLLAQAFLPADPDRPFVNHIDGDRANNTVENLEWVTHQENVTHSRAILKKNAKRLTEDQVRDIRATYEAGGITQKQLATRYQVSEDAIQVIITRRWWKHL